MDTEFHLSLEVPALKPSQDFFTGILAARVRHRDASGYVNLDLAGVQLTLKEAPGVTPPSDAIHFGINVDAATFEAIVARVREHAPQALVAEPHVADAGTPRERRKLYLRCPAGYLLEIKGYAKREAAA